MKDQQPHTCPHCKQEIEGEIHGAVTHDCLSMPSLSPERVTVEQYIDLLNDRIVPWRLAELGFKPYKGESEFMRWENEAGYTIDVIGDIVYVNNASFNITTFSELQIQIRFLTPKT